MGRVLSPSSSPDERFASLAESFVGQVGISTGRMFGSEGLKVSSRVFALLVEGRLVVKVPATRVDELIAAGHGERFDPGHGRLMKEWVAIEPAADVDWPALAEEAREFVGGRGRPAP